MNLLSYRGCGIECRNGQVPVREFLRRLEDLSDRVKSNGSTREYKSLAAKLARCSFVSPKQWNNLLTKYLCAVQNDGEACLALGREIARNSKSWPDHKLRGKLLLIKSFNLGNALAALELGQWYARYGRDNSATKWFKKSFEKGCNAAGLELGRWFESLENYEIAEQYFRVVGKQHLIEYWFRRLNCAEAAELSDKVKIECEIDKVAEELCEEFKARGAYGESEVYERVGDMFCGVVARFPRERKECSAKKVAMAKGLSWYGKASTINVISALRHTGWLYLSAWSLENAERCFLKMGELVISHDLIELARSYWLIGNNDSAAKCILRSLGALKLSEWDLKHGKTVVDVSVEAFDGYGNYYLQHELRYVGLDALLKARKTEECLAQLKIALRNAKTAHDSALCDMPF